MHTWMKRLALLTLLFTLGNAHGESLVFSNFASPAGLRFYSSAFTAGTTNGPVLRVVPSAPYMVGSVFTTNQYRANQFSCYFKFQITGQPLDFVPADGFAFVIKSSSAVLGDAGGSLAYAKGDQPGITNSIAVEFDIYRNSELDDPRGDHVGLDWGGLMRGSGFSSVLNDDLWRGDLWHAWIDYTGTNLQVRVNRTGIRPVLPLLQRTLDVTNELRGDRGFLGFTAANATGFANFDVLAWHYVDHYDPIITLGNPASSFVELNIYAPPTTQFATNGSPAVFAAGVAGTPPFSYQWRLNETDIPGATNAVYAIPSVQYSHLGQYQVRVTDAYREMFSKPVALQLVAREPLVAYGEVWRYADFGTNAAAGWTLLSFNDSTWRSGRGQLGYGDGDEATVVSYGPSTANRHITTYFRRAIVLPHPEAILKLNARMIRDDGAIVYVNGQEAIRLFMPPGPVNASTRATWSVSGSEETTPAEFELPLSLFQPGTNVIAVEIHQSAPDSSDISFDLQLTGLVEMPTMTLRREESGDYFALWPSGASAVRVQFATNLVSPVRWTTLPGINSTENGYEVWPLPAPAGPAMFYRLVKP